MMVDSGARGNKNQIKTADSGYMTRKLVDVSQDVIVTQEDCGTSNGLTVFALDEDEGSISNRIYGRVAAEKVTRPDGEVICEIDDLLDEEKSNAIEDLGLDKMTIRSALTCESDHGICGRCYGQNLATGVMAKSGEAVGIIAAQSIGEPGTQLTMRTFHSGGVAFGGGSKPLTMRGRPRWKLRCSE